MQEKTQLTSAGINVRHLLIPILGLSWFAAIFANCAWLYEDAFISFRSIEQMHAGNGPVWNPDERVQVYTSAGWYWLGYLARLFTADYMLATLFWSALCCAGMLALLRRFFTTDLSWLAIVVLLTASRGVMDFSTSGLENPLGYLLVVAFAWYWREALSGPRPSRAALIKMFLVASLIPLARHDLVLLVIPVCVQALWLGRRSLSIPQWALLLAVAAAPLLLWTGFSLAYYGMPFPNTYYAKAATGIERIGLVQAGINYYLVNLFFDPVTVIGVLAGTYYLLRSKQIAIGLGLLLNLLYVLWLGGDYMLTRFLTYSFILVLACGGQGLVDKVRGNLRVWQKVVLVGCMVLLGLILWQETWQMNIVRWVSVVYQNTLLVTESPDGEILNELHRLEPRGLLLCMLLLSWLIWMPGVKWIQTMRGIPAVSLNGIALVGAGLAYLQFNPSATIHLRAPTDISVFSVVQLRHEIDFNKHSTLDAWLDHRQGIRRQEALLTKYALTNTYYIDGKPTLLSPKFPDLVWRKSGEYMGIKTDRVLLSYIGLAAYSYGVDGHIYDLLGIADPYIARLGVHKFSPFFRVAHWQRPFAAEYLTRDLTSETWQLGEDYQRLAQDVNLATRSPNLWTKERWQAIWRLISDQYTLPVPQDVLRLNSYFYLLRKDSCAQCLSVISVLADSKFVPLKIVIGRDWWARQINLGNNEAVLFSL